MSTRVCATAGDQRQRTQVLACSFDRRVGGRRKGGGDWTLATGKETRTLPAVEGVEISAFRGKGPLWLNKCVFSKEEPWRRRCVLGKAG